MERLTVRTVSFLAEKDGLSERALKTALIPLLSGSTVRRAFLALVEYDAGTISVALCIEGSIDDRSRHEIAITFQKMFSLSAALDILVLKEDQLAKIRAVCKPFYPSVNEAEFER